MQIATDTDKITDLKFYCRSTKNSSIFHDFRSSKLVNNTPVINVKFGSKKGSTG